MDKTATLDDKIEEAPVKNQANLGPGEIKSLLEKNLKWSQIIYEQNRKINRKLMWMAVGNWLKILIIVVPIVLGVIYLPSFIKNLTSKYGAYLPGKTNVTGGGNSVNDVLKLLPLDQSQLDKIKAMLK